MKTFGALGALALVLALAGCSKPVSISGTYGYSDAGGAAELILTENGQQQILGSFSIATLNKDGSMRRVETSITGGSYDPKTGSLALTVKANGLLTQAFNMTGQMANGGMDLTITGSTQHFIPSTTQDYAAAVAALTTKGEGEQLARAMLQKMDDDKKTVAALTLNLNTYNTQVENNKGGPQVARVMEEKIIAAAQKDIHVLEAMKAQGQGDSYPAGQVRYNIGQLDYQMGQVKYQVDNALQGDRSAIAGFDQRLAQSPCNANSAITGCAGLALQQQRYAKVRERIVAHEDELMADMQKNGAAMEALNHAAGN